MQVVTSENIQQLHETGRVDEFKAPDVKADATTEVKADVVKADDKPRDDAGKFVKPDVAEVTTDKADKTADEDSEDADLPERVRKQIGKKHRLMKEAEEFGKESYLARLAAEKRAEAAEVRLKQLESGNEKSKDSGEPDPKDFKTNAEYIDAMVEHKFEKKERAEAQKKYEQGQQKLQDEFVDRLNAARKDLPDFDEVVGDADFDVVPHIASYIAESELGPKLGYHFAKNPDELERIQKLSPIKGIAELGKLEMKLEKKPEATEKVEARVSVSKAPSPITTVASDAKTVVTKDPAKMSFQELREFERNKALKR